MRVVEHLHSVGVGQAQVDDQRVVGEAGQPVERIGGVCRLSRSEPLGFECGHNRAAQRGIVFDDQDGRLGWMAHMRNTSIE